MEQNQLQCGMPRRYLSPLDNSDKRSETDSAMKMQVLRLHMTGPSL
jgi:hypothetical protein